MVISISDIKVRKRIRKENGDINSLMESLQTHGLINPIVVTEKFELIAGFRRYTAAKTLGWDTIPATIVEASGKLQRLELEMEENLQRLDFSDEELFEGIAALDKYRNPRGFRGVWCKILSIFEKFFDKIEASKAEKRKRNGFISLLSFAGIGIMVGSGVLYHNSLISSALLTLLNIFGFAVFIFGLLFFVRYIRGLQK